MQSDGSHGHAHGAGDAELLASDKGIRALKISLAGLLLTAVLQAGIALAGGSAALLADTLHNLADAFTAIPLWIAFRLARRAANRRYTYGYGRAEDLAGLVVMLFVLLSAGLAAYESIQKLFGGEPPRLIGLGIVAGFVGMIGNELVARYKMRVGKEIGSAALVAEGHHSRVDGLTSLAVVAGLGGVALGLPWADPVAGLLITVAILYILVVIGRDIFGRLLDAIDPELVTRMEQLAGEVEGVAAVHATRARWLGHAVTMELHISVDGGLRVLDAHRIAEQVRHRLLHEIPRLSDVVVHVDPLEPSPGEHHEVTAHHFGDGSAEQAEHGEHEGHEGGHDE
jgi:cation diffusion facilitator family transporter